MHFFDDVTQEIADEIYAYVEARLRMDPVPLDQPKTLSELTSQVGQTITKEGLGGHKVLEIFQNSLAPACISTDHPRYLSFIPNAPTELSQLFDLVVGASGIYGGSWLEGSGAVYAENQAINWISELIGFPKSAGGVFVQGGTLGNLSALVAAREKARTSTISPGRWVVIVSPYAHSSVESAAKVMDIDVVQCDVGEDLKLRGSDVLRTLQRLSPEQKPFAVIATAGSTNLGIVDEIHSIAEVAKKNNLWFHIDGAYGGAGVVAPSVRELYRGIEHADSFIVDPHKWLFAPFDACALIYRDPADAKKAHQQHASYLDTLDDKSEWNPSDLAVHLTRRPRGLPFWFSLASHGSLAYEQSVERTLASAKVAARMIKAHPRLELLFEPELSVVAFTRPGWSESEYREWSQQLLAKQIGFVTHSFHAGQPILRFAIVNPRTDESDFAAILSQL